jgi:hypothetical protein
MRRVEEPIKMRREHCNGLVRHLRVRVRVRVRLG